MISGNPQKMGSVQPVWVTVYVPKELTEEVQASLREHRRLKQLLREITRLELARIRLHLTQSRRRGTRR